MELEPEPITILEEPRTEPGTETDKFIDTNILLPVPLKCIQTFRACGAG